MNFRFLPSVCIGILAASTVLAAAPGRDSADPLAAIDRNRVAIVADIATSFGGGEALRARLARLRADRLLAASLAASPASLEAILAEAPPAQGALAFAPASAKALGDSASDLVYTPLAPCRLIDTRGFGAPFVGGMFVPGERRAYAPAGACGIPGAGVASLMVSFTTQNSTPNSGGFLSMIAPGQPVLTSVDVFNLGAEWSASNTVVATGAAGEFDIFVSTATAHVVIDVLGYFAPPQIGNLVLPHSSSAAAGNLFKGGSSFLHNFNSLSNVFLGIDAGNFTTIGTGTQNVGVGRLALHSLADGFGNTAIGDLVLESNTEGANNTAVGRWAMRENSTGNNNVAVGLFALRNNVSGHGNTAVGPNAGINLTTGSDNVMIAAYGAPGMTNTVAIGTTQTRAFIAGIRGIATGNNNAVPVVIDSLGQLGTINSSREVKVDIADMGAATDALMRLRPVTFHYRHDRDPAGRRLQYGLVAEEVAEVYPGMVAHAPDGSAETVLYQFLPPMLLNEVQRQHRANAAQQRTIEQQAREIEALKRAVEALASRGR